MLKVVYNACYGGFGLSDEAYILYAKLKGIDIYPEKGSYGCTHYYLQPVTGVALVDDRREELYYDNIERHDKVLVQVVEQLGDDASGRYAELKIAESGDSNMYRIDEYDGNESVLFNYTDDSWVIVGEDE
jgi:hypothetical protein